MRTLRQDVAVVLIRADEARKGDKLKLWDREVTVCLTVVEMGRVDIFDVEEHFVATLRSCEMVEVERLPEPITVTVELTPEEADLWLDAVDGSEHGPITHKFGDAVRAALEARP